jgi:hypothetical protein
MYSVVRTPYTWQPSTFVNPYGSLIYADPSVHEDEIPIEGVADFDIPLKEAYVHDVVICNPSAQRAKALKFYSDGFAETL